MVAEGPVVAERLLTFRVGLGRFAVALEDVRGVLEPVAVEAGAECRVMSQGHRVAAVDARGLGWGGADPGQRAPAGIMIGTGARPTMLIVDRVECIVEGVEMRPLPALVAPFVRGVFRGIALQADGNRLVIDAAALLGAAGKPAASEGQGGPGEA